MSDAEHDPSGNENLSFHAGADVITDVIFVITFYSFPCIVAAKT